MGHSDNRVRFAQFEADLRSGELFEAGVKVPLQEKPFQVLAMLVKRAPEAVTREEIFAKVWSDAHVQQQLSLNTSMRKLRRALRDNGRKPHLIGTTAEGYRLLVEARPVSRTSVAPAEPSPMRLAVAPFRNMGPGAQEYFADGLTEQMIALLGQTQKQIRVIAPFSTLQYKGTTKSVVEIGREFNADYVLSGTVALRDGQVRVTAMLVHGRDESILWSDVFSRPRGDIFAIEDEIASRIARSILTLLTAPEVRARSLSTSPAAYEAYLRGCFFANKWTAEGFRKAIDWFQQAVRTDPEFAPAHASLAKLYMGMSAQGILRPEIINQMTVAAASEALRLCPDLADAHIALGWAQLFYEGDWEASESSFLRAIEINPSSDTAYDGYAHLLTAMARHDEAIEVSRRACALNPLSPFAANVHACNYYFARRYDEALQQCLRNVETEAAFGIGHSSLGWVYEALGHYDKAIAAHRTAVKYNVGSPAMLANLSRVLALSGEIAEARSTLQQVLAAREAGWQSEYWVALAYVGMGEHTLALDSLANTLEERDGWRVFLGVDPKLEPLSDNPRFKALLKSVGIPLHTKRRRSKMSASRS